MIEFACNSCGKSFRTQHQVAGKQIRCPGCKTAILIPPKHTNGQHTENLHADDRAHLPVEPDSNEPTQQMKNPDDGKTLPPTGVEDTATIPPESDVDSLNIEDAQASVREMPTLAPRSEEQNDATLPPKGPAREPGTIPPEKTMVESDLSHIKIPGYEILQELGRGGMGVVYKARHLKLNRLVALKMILSGAHAGSSDILRFLTEAEAVASFQHPNVVQVFEVSQHNKLPFMALEFVDGGTLAGKLIDGPMSARKAAQLVETMARGMNAAHQAGIVHRDLKPDNVLLTKDGVPKITDFGLAKRVQGGSGLTQTGAIMGTPSYMAPEQAGGEGKRVGPAADLYALGAILYCCLTGRPPFQAENPLDTVLKVVSDDPKPPKQINPKVPRDLETICLKCLDKSPQKRYPHAEALAEDLRRWQQGKPITARPVGRVERTVKWVRRNQGITALIMLVFLVMVFGFSGVIWSLGVALKNEQQMKVERQRAYDALLEADEQKFLAIEKTRKATEALKIAAREKLRAEKQLDRAEWQIYLGNLREAQLALDVGDFGTAKDRLEDCRWDFRGWEHDHLFTRLHHGIVTMRGHTGVLRCVAFSPDGRRIASGCGGDRRIIVWDALTGQPVHHLSYKGNVASISFSPNGKQLVSATGNEILVWDVNTGEKRVINSHKKGVTCVNFSPDGQRILSGSSDGTMRIWEVRTGKQLSKIKTGSNASSTVRYSPDGKYIVSAHPLQIWDPETGRKVVRLLTKETLGGIQDIKYSPDGLRIVAAGGSGILQTWDAKTGQPLQSFIGHTGVVRSACFSPDGRQLVSASVDQTVKLWDVETGEEVRMFRGHSSTVACVDISPDGRRIVSGGHDQTVKIWDSRSTTEPVPCPENKGRVAWHCYSSDGKLLVTPSAPYRNLVLWDTSTGRKLKTFQGNDLNDPVEFAFSPDGKRLVSRHRGGGIIIRDSDTGEIFHSIKEETDKTTSLAYHPHRPEFVTGCQSGLVHVRNAETGKIIESIPGHRNWVMSLAYSPDGKLLASGSADSTINLRNAHSRKLLHTIRFSGKGIQCIAFSPDGNQLVAGSRDGSIRKVHIATGREELHVEGHTGPVISLDYHPNGKRILSGSDDGTFRLWDSETGYQLLTFRKHSSRVCAMFSPDGKQIASGSSDRTIFLWNADVREEEKSLPGITSPMKRVSFDQEGKFIIGEDKAGKILAWNAKTGRQLTDSDDLTFPAGSKQDERGLVYRSEILTEKQMFQRLNVNVDIKGAKRLFLVVTDGGNGTQRDHGNWVEPTLLDAAGNKTKLTQLPWTIATAGWNSPQKNTACNGTPLMVAGDVFKNGIGTHANSVIAYDLPEGFLRFQCGAGIDSWIDGVGDRKVVRLQFHVYVDHIPPGLCPTYAVSPDGNQIALIRENTIEVRPGHRYRSLQDLTRERLTRWSQLDPQ